MRTPEGREADKIDAFLDDMGVWYCKPRTGGYGKSGVPDRVCCFAGYFFSIEIKRPAKEPTPLQTLRAKEIQSAGGRAYWGPAEKVVREIQAWMRRKACGGPVVEEFQP